MTDLPDRNPNYLLNQKSITRIEVEKPPTFFDLYQHLKPIEGFDGYTASDIVWMGLKTIGRISNIEKKVNDNKELLMLSSEPSMSKKEVAKKVKEINPDMLEFFKNNSDEKHLTAGIDWHDLKTDEETLNNIVKDLEGYIANK